MKFIGIFGLFIGLLTIISGFVILNDINSIYFISKNRNHYQLGIFKVNQVKEVVRSIGTNKGGVTGIATGVVDGLEYEYTLDWENNQNWPFKPKYSNYRDKYLNVAYSKYYRKKFERTNWKRSLDIVPATVFLKSESLKWGRSLKMILLIFTGLLIIKLSLRLLVTSNERCNLSK